ncbi:GNAT family N-acetyltransferase [Actinokineospora iranica]|uniref:Putative acetyltransferase n=1 Tax=Actinokineospora iranica TaxID=1271860 RepID=A0A1G6IN93_9PSEU|nr:GNAT family N-acetyltransferase [Actinokineospora iranica]SDC07900.1 putative acetyltransferase [Actinokineospora iranica]
MAELTIAVDDLSGARIAEFLRGHTEEMRSITPPGSKHALDLDGLREPEVTFWTVLDGDGLVGCGALKELDAGHGEIKSMRVAGERMGQGVGSTLLRHIIGVAVERGYSRLSLETGSFGFFAPARGLYAKHGFEVCGPFAGYREDPNSVFMTKVLGT